MDLLASVGTYIVPFLIILSVVVFVHEFGHYVIARLNGVRVQVFSIGFGPELFGVTDRAGTRWKVSAVPLGGYVKMHGDADATSSTIDLSALPDPDSFPAKRVGQRMAIVVAGPLANFVFAMIALALLFATVGRPFTPAEVGEVQPGSPAEAAGLIPGDRILAVDGEAIASFEELQGIVRGHPEQDAHLHHRARRRDARSAAHARTDRDRGPVRPDPQDRFDRRQPIGGRIPAIEPGVRRGRRGQRDVPSDRRARSTRLAR